jgi:hypothetical protein
MRCNQIVVLKQRPDNIGIVTTVAAVALCCTPIVAQTFRIATRGTWQVPNCLNWNLLPVLSGDAFLVQFLSLMLSNVAIRKRGASGIKR